MSGRLLRMGAIGAAIVSALPPRVDIGRPIDDRPPFKVRSNTKKTKNRDKVKAARKQRRNTK